MLRWNLRLLMSKSSKLEVFDSSTLKVFLNGCVKAPINVEYS